MHGAWANPARLARQLVSGGQPDRNAYSNACAPRPGRGAGPSRNAPRTNGAGPGPSAGCPGRMPGNVGAASANSSPAAAKRGQEMVIDVRVVGNKSLPLSKIVPNIHTRPNRPYDPEAVQEDVRRLDRTHMFLVVKPYLQRVNGGIIVIYELLERPLLKEVLFIGCDDVHKKVLQKEAEIKVGDAADPMAIEEARRKLEEILSQAWSQRRANHLVGRRQAARPPGHLPDQRRREAEGLAGLFSGEYDCRRRTPAHADQIQTPVPVSLRRRTGPHPG